ncbi:Uncharacterised protein [Vibrio cholerae]|nr:Uncharacterised protein [Vibrio cholerae]CSI69149.1 Uncharacterised protein [Vibrio cholerae]
MVSIVSVQRGHTQMPRFRESHRVFHGFSAADFTNQNHIGGLAQRVFQRHFITFGIKPHFSLRHDTALVFMHKLNGIFDRQNMPGAMLITIASHGCHSGRFTRTGCANHQH